MVFPALGTTAVIVTTDPAVAGEVRVVVDEEIAAFDRACSRFRDDSELTHLNAHGGSAVEVSALLLEAIVVALRVAAQTDGIVDPTVGTAMRVLGYDRDFSAVERSGEPLQLSVGPVPGWRVVVVDGRRRTVGLPHGVEIDLGATAKALCADRAAARAARETGCGVLVSLGGDVATAGPCPPDGWAVLISDDHAAPLDSAGQTIAIRGGGLATSGTSVRRWARGGRSLHHIVDPATGDAAVEIWRTVSVVAASCVDANAASTAAVIMGDRAIAWLASRALPSRLVAVDGAVTTIGGWPS